MEKLTKEEIFYLISLVKAEKEALQFIRGFGKLTQEEQDRNEKFNQLIKKLLEE